MSGGPRIVTAVRNEPTFEGMSAAALENLERRTTAFLYAIWDMQGVKKKIVRVESSNGNYGEMEMVKE